MRAAVIGSGTSFRQWELDCIRKLREAGVSVSFVLVAPVPSGDGTGERSLLYRKLSRYLRKRCSSMARADIRRAFPLLRCLEYDKLDALRRRQLGKEKLDFILSFHPTSAGANLFRASYGVWRFVHGDNETMDGADILASGLLSGTDTVSIALVASLKGRGGILLKRGVFSSRIYSFTSHLNQINRFCSDWPAYVCKELAHREEARASASLPAVSGLASAPLRVSSSQTIRLAAKMLRNNARRGFKRWFLTEHWNVGIADRPIESFLADPVLPEVSWIPKRFNFLADPFGVQLNGQMFILAEEYDYASRKGVITALRPEAEGSPRSGQVVLDLPVHVSYPYILEHEGGIYCVPETYQAGEVSLFKATKFPDRWEKVATLIEGFQAVDATIFRHDGLWWLFCTDENSGWNSHLYIWYAAELLGEWRPHPLNPVKMDVRSSRPAGTPFYHEGKLYRPAQDCSRTYGGAVVLNRVEVLTPTAFEERPVAKLAPDPNGPYRHGIHTLSSVGGRTLVDAKRTSVNWKVFWLRVITELAAKLD